MLSNSLATAGGASHFVTRLGLEHLEAVVHRYFEAADFARSTKESCSTGNQLYQSYIYCMIHLMYIIL